MNFLPGDIVLDDWSGNTARVTRTDQETATVQIVFPNRKEVTRAAGRVSHASPEDAASHKAEEHTRWQAEVTRLLLKRLEQEGIDSMHASDVRMLLDIASRYVEIPPVEYWKR